MAYNCVTSWTYTHLDYIICFQPWWP